MAECLLGDTVRVAGRDASDLGLEDLVGTLPQGDDGGGEALLVGDRRELLRRTVDDPVGVVGGLQFFQRRVDSDRFQVEQVDAVHAGHIRVDVAGEAEVDHELAGRVVHRAARRSVTVEGRHALTEGRAAGGECGGVEDESGCRRAGHDDRGVCGFAREGIRLDGADGVACGESGCAAGGREDGDVGDSAVTECGEARSGVRSGADEEHAHRRPVDDAALGQIEGEPDDRAAGAAERSVVLHAAGGLRCALEQSLEVAGGRACLACAFE